jgi:hypothetical protein
MSAKGDLNRIEKRLNDRDPEKKHIVLTQDLDDPDLYYLDGFQGEEVLTLDEAFERFPDNEIVRIVWVDDWRKSDEREG